MNRIRARKAARYVPPTDWKQSSLGRLLAGTGRNLQPASGRKSQDGERRVFTSGDVALLKVKRVETLKEIWANLPSK